ncbi:MAG: hypothetical protein QNK35_04020 [Bacteroides sp.]|nr:hypothetical protein [Bacteroides sp.]
MKRLFLPLFVLSLILMSSCELSSEKEPEVVLLPTNMTATVIMGSNTTKIIADFSYIPDSDLLDHITWSNHQTHYFEYNEKDQLKVVRQLKVKEKVQEEYWFTYEGELISEVILVKKNLDYAYLEPIDSSYTGRIAYEYEGKLIIRESEYGVQKGNKKEYLLREASYEYDGGGNILNSSTTYTKEDEADETVIMSYDSGKHPFSGLNYYFTGESFVNNQLTKTIGMMAYSYDVTLNEENYPEVVYEKLGSSNSRIFRYTYKNR